VAPNSGGYARTGVINVAGQSHLISQAARQTQPACAVSISPAQVTAGPEGGGGTIAVAANCAWSASTDARWVQITSGGSASGSGTIAYTVARNPGATSRTGVIVVAGQVHRISQSGVALPQVGECSFQFNPPSGRANAGPGSGRLNLNATNNCSWTASTNAAWLTIVSSPVGRGSGVIDFRVAANNTPSQRSGSIIIGKSSYTIVQDPGAPAANYEALIAQAHTAYRGRNYNLAGQLARQALQMDPARPDAYDILGHMDFYLAGNVAAAAQNMRAAIARGGKASFIVRHDHAKLTFAQSCGGYLHIWRDRISFTGEDQFQVTRAEVKEAKPNRSWVPIPAGNNLRPQGSAFHIETRYRNYNMMGTSRMPKEEMNLILDLIGKG
jgi:hypothetical protein